MSNPLPIDQIDEELSADQLEQIQIALANPDVEWKLLRDWVAELRSLLPSE